MYVGKVKIKYKTVGNRKIFDSDHEIGRTLGNVTTSNENLYENFYRKKTYPIAKIRLILPSPDNPDTNFPRITGRKFSEKERTPRNKIARVNESSIRPIDPNAIQLPQASTPPAGHNRNPEGIIRLDRSPRFRIDSKGKDGISRRKPETWIHLNGDLSI